MSRRMTKPIKWLVHPAKTQISLGTLWSTSTCIGFHFTYSEYRKWIKRLLHSMWGPTFKVVSVWSVFAVHMNKAWVLSYPLRAQQRLWSDLVDAQADLSLCWTHKSCHFVSFVMLWLKWTLYLLWVCTSYGLHILTWTPGWSWGEHWWIQEWESLTSLSPHHAEVGATTHSENMASNTIPFLLEMKTVHVGKPVNSSIPSPSAHILNRDK